MGQSTDALAAFGFDLGSSEDFEWPEALAVPDDDGNPEAWPDLSGYLERRAGLTKPTTGDYKDPAWSAYWAAAREAEVAFPVDLVQHCSGEYPMWIFALRRTVQRASRGSPSALTAGIILGAEVAAMKALCEEMGLPWSEPAWLLFSNWN